MRCRMHLPLLISEKYKRDYAIFAGGYNIKTVRFAGVCRMQIVQNVQIALVANYINCTIYKPHFT